MAQQLRLNGLGGVTDIEAQRSQMFDRLRLYGELCASSHTLVGPAARAPISDFEWADLLTFLSKDGGQFVFSDDAIW
jgi:hypothetical protein